MQGSTQARNQGQAGLAGVSKESFAGERTSGQKKVLSIKDRWLERREGRGAKATTRRQKRIAENEELERV
ncbi:hypothetical protein BT69DRAFT_1286044, partial [Atractiella rhizophila]